MKLDPLPHLPFVGRIQKLNVNASFPLGKRPELARESLFFRKKMPPFAMSLPSPKWIALPDTPSSTKYGLKVQAGFVRRAIGISPALEESAPQSSGLSKFQYAARLGR